MKIGVIQGSSRKERNRLLCECTENAIRGTGYQLVNFGVRDTEDQALSYVQTAFLVYLLLESKSVDFIVTGCSSGQGMMLACNRFPGVLCGYTPTPADACLFGRINAGNAASLPLGLNFGWAGELNLQYTLNALFEAPFGIGYPPQEAQRKQQETDLLKAVGSAVKLELPEILARLEPDFVRSCLGRECVRSYIVEAGGEPSAAELLKDYLGE